MKVVLAVLGGVALAVIGPAFFERLAPPRFVRAYQKFVGNPLLRPFAGIMPGWAVIETIGRRTGRAHQVPVGGKLRGSSFWLVAGNGRRANYVQNIEANPRVRVKMRGRWRSGAAYALNEDNARRRLLGMNPVHSFFIWIAGTDLLTIRVDLDP